MAIETILAIASIGATAVSTVGSIVGAQQQSAALNARAEYDRANAEQARINAGTALNVGEAEVQRGEMQARRRAAAAFAQAGASGVDPAFGSPLDLMGDIAAEGALDTQIQRWKAVNQAQGYVTQAGNFAAQGAMNDQAAGEASTAGLFRAGGTLLGGLSNYAMMRTRMGGI